MNFNPDKAREAQERELAVERANSDPLPGPLASAFIVGPIEIKGGLPIRPVTGSADIIILKQLNSPLYRQMLENDSAARKSQKDGKVVVPEDVIPSDEEAVELCFQFTRPTREVRSTLRQGRVHFTEQACTEIADKYSPDVIFAMVGAVYEQMARSVRTQVQHEQEATDGDGKTTQKKIVQLQGQETASVGS